MGPQDPGGLQAIAEGWRAAVGAFGAAVLSAVVGRLAWHTSQVRKGCRRFWSLELLWELPLAVFMGLLGGGLAEWLGLGTLAASGLAAVCGWLGPRGVEAMLLKIAEARGWK